MSSNLFVEGRRVADAIESCHIKLNYFIYSYDNWFPIREKRIQTLLNSENELKSLDTNFDGDCVSLMDIIPAERNWRALFVAISNAWSLLYNFVRNTRKRQSNGRRIFFKILDMHKKDHFRCQRVFEKAVQCSSQFQETRQIIEEFHSLVKEEVEGNLESIIEDKDILEFLKEISYLNPLDTSIFYTRLRICYETHLQESRSTESKNFIGVFENKPGAIQVISLLPWKFNAVDFDADAVNRTHVELVRWFNLAETFDPEKCGSKIFDCVHELRKEQELLECLRAELELLRNHS